MFYQILKHAHSAWRWAIVILMITAIVVALVNWVRKNKKTSHKINVYALISVHIQLIFGLVLYFVSPRVVFSASTMSERMLRFYTVEHFLLMVIAIVLLTIGYSKSKKRLGTWQYHRTIFVFYIIAFVLMLAGIPWPFMDLGGGWI